MTEGVSFVCRKPAENPAHDISADRNLSDTDPYPWERVGSELFGNVPESLLTAVASLPPYPQLTDIEIYVVTDDDDIFRRDFVKSQQPFLPKLPTDSYTAAAS